MAVKAPQPGFAPLTDFPVDAVMPDGTIEDGPRITTPPFGEVPIYDVVDPMEAAPAPEIRGRVDEDAIHNRINGAYGHRAHHLRWWNDDQLDGTAVPPGAPNAQPFMSGHTQIVVHNPASEQGWGQDPAFRWPRYPHMQNSFPGYSTGIHRRNGELALTKTWATLWRYTQQQRDLLLRRVIASRKGPHGRIIGDTPSVPFTANVMAVQPGALSQEAPIGAEGVLPA